MEAVFNGHVLVHICCSVDSHHFLSELRKRYPHATFTGFFYNPNIHPFEEYHLRWLDVARSCQQLGIDLIDDEYEVSTWLSQTQGYEQAPEKGERCSLCFDVRLHKTAKKARELSISHISTTLLASPMKAQNELFALGKEIASQYDLGFIALDTRSCGGTQRQQALAKEARLYRQNYCGCLYALDAQRQKSGKKAYELVCVLPYERYLKQPINKRLQAYQKRLSLERNAKAYHLYKRREWVYYPFYTHLQNQQKQPIACHALAYSLSAQKGRRQKFTIEWVKDGVGYSDRAEVFLMSIERFNELAQTSFTLMQLMCGACSIEKELEVRACLEGGSFGTSLILVLDSFEIGDVFYVIHEATCQEEMIEEIMEA